MLKFGPDVFCLIFNVIVLSTRAVELLCHSRTTVSTCVGFAEGEVVIPLVGKRCLPSKESSRRTSGTYTASHKRRNQLIVRTLLPPRPTSLTDPLDWKKEGFFFLLLGCFFNFFCPCSCGGGGEIRSSHAENGGLWSWWLLTWTFVACNSSPRELSSPLNARKSLRFFLSFWRRQNSALVKSQTHCNLYKYKYKFSRWNWTRN